MHRVFFLAFPGEVVSFDICYGSRGLGVVCGGARNIRKGRYGEMFVGVSWWKSAFSFPCLVLGALFLPRKEKKSCVVPTGEVGRCWC